MLSWRLFLLSVRIFFSYRSLCFCSWLLGAGVGRWRAGSGYSYLGCCSSRLVAGILSWCRYSYG